ncbi:hypothetical protein CLOP_g2472 [Closterium sp. NIES-67]|nr:hypothetical protein CLOP_g2472 [Closterium sp. NIES-67]
MSPYQSSCVCVLFLLFPAALVARAASADVVPLEGRRYVRVGATDPKFNYGWNPKVNFTAWAEDPANRVYEGDVLVFYYPTGADEVYRFSSLADMQRCAYPKATRVCRDVDGAAGCKVLASAGTALYASGMAARCNTSMQVAVEVAVASGPRDIVVGYPTGDFSWPWNPAVNYTDWLLNNTLYSGDVLYFKYAAHMDEVYIVPTQADYDACKYDRYTAYCNATDGVGEGCFSNPLDNSTTFFLSGVYSHCTASQKLATVALDGPPGA